MDSNSPPGWYADPKAPHLQRYWDGSDWTDHAAPALSGANGTPSGVAELSSAGVQQNPQQLREAEPHFAAAADPWLSEVRNAILQYSAVKRGKLLASGVWETEIELTKGLPHEITPDMTVKVERVGQVMKTQGWVFKETTDDREDHVTVTGSDWVEHLSERQGSWFGGGFGFGLPVGRSGSAIREYAAVIKEAALRSSGARHRLAASVAAEATNVIRLRQVPEAVNEQLDLREIAGDRVVAIRSNNKVRDPLIEELYVSYVPIGRFEASADYARESFGGMVEEYGLTAFAGGARFYGGAIGVIGGGLAWMADRDLVMFDLREIVAAAPSSDGDALIILDSSGIAKTLRVRPKTGGLRDVATRVNEFAFKYGISFDNPPQQVAPASTVEPSATYSADMLVQLASLHDRGILTDAEFAQKKQEILDRM